MKTSLSIFALGCFLILAQPAAAYIEQIVVTPEQPEEGDVLYVDVFGYLPDSCWDVAGTYQEVVGQEIRVIVDLLDSWEPGTSCLTVVIPYDAFFEFVGLAAGDYSLAVTERHESARDPEDQVIVLPIEITGPVTASSASWTAIKSLYQ